MTYLQSARVHLDLKELTNALEYILAHLEDKDKDASVAILPPEIPKTQEEFEEYLSLVHHWAVAETFPETFDTETFEAPGTRLALRCAWFIGLPAKLIAKDLTAKNEG